MSYSQDRSFLNVARQIGNYLMEEAIWHEDRCTWFGFSSGGQRNPSYRKYATMGPALYDGTSGVAWFLAHLASVTGCDRARETALAATRHALRQFELQERDASFGLFDGWVGICLVTARVSLLLHAPELLERVVVSLEKRVADLDCGESFDIISGRAGAIVGSLVLSEMLDSPALTETAMRIGDELLASADQSAAGWSWKGPAKLQAKNLAGYSHGAAGIGHALVELFQVSGAVKYRDAAEKAFAYEQHWFDAASLNWPDFRKEPDESAVGKRRYPFNVLWCHGAPGIALSRIRAYEVLGEEDYRNQAEVALQTTRADLVPRLSGGSANFCLCHGLAGNAEVLALGSRIYGGQRYRNNSAAQPQRDEELIESVARAGISNYADDAQSWPGGNPGGYTPGLMLGLAGTGYFYLRLYEPRLPSILLLERGAYRRSTAAEASTSGIGAAH